MRKKRKAPQKVKPPKQTSVQPIIPTLPFHLTFPITLHHKSEKKFCYFVDESHLLKYMERCKLKMKDVKITKTLPKEET
jgi:hypothetical protein